MTALRPQERTALDQIAVLTDPAKLRTLLANARRIGSDAVGEAAFRRLCFVQPASDPGTVEHDVWQSIHVLEEMLREERGKTVRLSRTRQKIAKDGEAKTAADLTLKTVPSDGFRMLIERRRPELTFEDVVLRHPDVFDDAPQLAARARLSAAAIDPEQFIPGGT